MKTVTEYLREVNQNFESQKSKGFPFNERESAKAELVRSLLKKVDNNKLKP
jgi:hypothetical protein